MTPAFLTKILGSVTHDISSEAALQDGLERCLQAAGIEYEREVKLSSTDRIDFMVGRVGIEVKTGGGKSALLRQLHRYAQSDRVDAMIVVTSAPRLGSLPPSFNGKPIQRLILSSCLI